MTINTNSNRNQPHHEGAYFTASELEERTRLLVSIVNKSNEKEKNGCDQVVMMRIEGLELLQQIEADIESAILNGTCLNDDDDDDDSYANDSFDKHLKRVPRTKYRRRKPTEGASRRNSCAANILKNTIMTTTTTTPHEHSSPSHQSSTTSRMQHNVVQRRFSNQAA